MYIEKKIKNIVFDLGNVLIDLDENETIKGFKKDISAFYKNSMNSKFIDIAHKFERGEISSANFRENVSKIFNLNLSSKEFDFHWNAMIIGMPIQRQKMLVKLRKAHKLFVLSNTNEIHYNYFTKQNYWNPSLFDKVYFSHHLGMRKPEKEIFEYVLNQNNLIPEETFFVDDNKENIKTAQKLNIISSLVNKDIEIIIKNNFKI